MMEFPSVDLILRIIEVFAQVAIVATFAVYWRMSRTMRDQLNAAFAQVHAARDASRSQNILSAISFLQQEHIQNARGQLMGLSGRSPNSWSDEERKSADVACATYDIIGILCRNEIIPSAIIVDNWGDSIIKCRDAAGELIDQYRDPSLRGPAFWDDLDWLYEQSKESPQWGGAAA